MRLLNLDLIAFGPFSGAKFEFGGTTERPGLHVVYGPNEAGKSSTLRALRAVLFGFPGQTSDNFIHPYSQLRVGATLENREGRVLSFVRRKGVKNTLLTADEKTSLGDDVLRPFVSNIKETEFFSMFAIGHQELRTGGQEILQGQGQLSELLFMTGGGLPQLRRIERSFQDEAEKLFKPSGKNPPINDAILRIKELRALQKEKSLLAADYLRHTEALASAKNERSAIEQESAELRIRKSRLDRLSKALPTAARLKQLRVAFAAVADAPQLPTEFSSRRESIEREARSLTGRIEQLQTDLSGTEAQLGALSVPTELLDARVEIEHLFKRLGSHEKAQEDARERLAEAAQLESDINALLRSIGPNLSFNDAESLRLTRQEQATIRERAARGRELSLSTRKQEQEIERLTDRIAKLDAELVRLGDVRASDALREAVKRAQRDGDLEGSLHAAETQRHELNRRLERSLAALPLWDGTSEDLLRIAVPPLSTVDRFERAYERIERDLRRLQELQAEIVGSLRDVERDLAEIRRDGDVPSEDSLREARDYRDQGWREIRRELNGLGPGAEREGFLGVARTDALPEAYETAVRTSDEVADRLHREAERVERSSRAQRDLDELHARRDKLAAEAAKFERDREELASEWGTHWSFLKSAPLTPREMRDWLARYSEVTRLAEEHRVAQKTGDDLQKRIGDHRAALTSAMGEGVDSSTMALSTLIEVADRTVKSQEKGEADRTRAIAEREQIVEERRAFEIESKADGAEFEALKAEWGTWMARLGLAADAKSEAALAVLDTLTEVFDKLRAVEGLKERIQAMADDATTFERDVKEAASRLLPEVATRPIEEVATLLNDRYREALSLNDRRAELEGRVAKLKRDRQESTRRAAELDQELAALCLEAGCADAADLPAIERRAAERRRVETQLEQAEKELHERSGGRAVDEFLKEIEAAEPDRIDPDLESVEQQLDERGEKRIELERVITQHEQELGRMIGGAEAVTAAEDAQGVIAQLANQIERYAKLRFAVKLLRDGRESYREKTKNSVLDSAGKLFGQLTGQSFRSLLVDWSDSDEQILVGVRRDGQKVHVEGMSDGTADQLYLALRLAGLSAWLDDHEPLPFLVDDILVHFDDERSKAALAALASLAERTQVILFTHHAHIRDLAQEAVPGDLLQLHEIGGETSSRLATSELPAAETVEPVKGNGRSKRSLF